MARHLHEQSGGNPRDQGPVPELANEPVSPRADDDFPDTPEGNRSAAGEGDLTDEQLDDLADRLGLSDDAAGERAVDVDVDADADAATPDSDDD